MKINETCKTEIYSEICCDICNEVVHNHFECPICKDGYAGTDIYGKMFEDSNIEYITCESCGAEFECFMNEDYDYIIKLKKL